MRALAEFVMRGRLQAAGVALACSFLPLISPAVVGLVTLRRGGPEGVLIAAWAFLPVAVASMVGLAALAEFFVYLSMLTALFGGALVLRAGAVWSHSLFSILAISVTGGAVFAWTFPELLNQMIEELKQLQSEVAERAQGPVQEQDVVPLTGTYISGAVAAAVAVLAVLSLVLGRWWQALLYNPGGFRQEFHELRLSKTQTLLSFGAAAICMPQPDYLFWGLLAALPLVLVTTAVVHNRVYARGAGIHWLVLYYIAAFAQPLVWLTILVGLSDPWVDYRRRFGPPSPPAEQT